MNSFVPKEKLEQYLNLEIDDDDLFPADAPSGTLYYDLKPENNEPFTVKASHIVLLLNKFIDGEIGETRIKEYVEALIALDLFAFDDSSDIAHDLVSNAIFTLDELIDVKGKVTKDEAISLRNNLLYSNF